MGNKVDHICIQCGSVTRLSSRWSIKRKKYPDLCGKCAQATKQTTVVFNSKRDWSFVYNDPSQTADTLTEAKQQGLKFYKRICDIHGPVPYATLDNTCRQCTSDQAKKRKTENREFNQPRIIEQNK